MEPRANPLHEKLEKCVTQPDESVSTFPEKASTYKGLLAAVIVKNAVVRCTSGEVEGVGSANRHSYHFPQFVV